MNADVQPIMSRRELLQKGSAALAAATLAPRLMAAPSPSGRKIRIGVVGGNFGRQFQWHEHPNCVVAAVSDLRPERRAALAKTYRCDKTYESLEKLILDPAIDAVAVFTGAPDHVRHAVAVMKAGKHVISAVPACTSLEDAQRLVDAVRQTGQTYMMAETSYYRQPMIAARQFYRDGRFGKITYTESEYHHPGGEVLWFENGKPTWRHGLPPLLYPTHCTSFLVGLTGERLTAVSAMGTVDDSPLIKGNPYNNSFCNAVALFRTNQGNAMRLARSRKSAVAGTERAEWYGEKMSFLMGDPNHMSGPVLIHAAKKSGKDDAGFATGEAKTEPYVVPEFWKSDMVPEPLRHASGHDNSHTFLTHEFITALLENRKPAVDVYEALAYTVPGIVAHQSALRGGEQLNIPSFDPKV